MKSFAESAVALGLLRVAQPIGARFPGRNGTPGRSYVPDVRGALANIDLRRVIVGEMAYRFGLDFEDAEMVVGLAKAGISWAALVARELNLPAGVVHLDGPRKSGLQRQIEGSVAGRWVVLVDNLTCTQGSLIDAARIIETNGGKILGAMTVIRLTAVGPEHVPAWFQVSSLCNDGELEAEGRRQKVLLPEHKNGLTDVAAHIPPLSGSNTSNLNAKEAIQ